MYCKGKSIASAPCRHQTPQRGPVTMATDETSFEKVRTTVVSPKPRALYKLNQLVSFLLLKPNSSFSYLILTK